MKTLSAIADEYRIGVRNRIQHKVTRVPTARNYRRRTRQREAMLDSLDRLLLSASHMKILVIEDSRLLRTTTERMLIRAGYEVITAADGEEGLRVAVESEPDLVILDMMLPKLSGQEVLQRLRMNPLSRSTPVIVLTSLSGSNRQKLLTEGASLYFEKTLVGAENGSRLLLDAIENLLKRASKPKAASPAR
jgi:DNA-binding response OmpR family regulator